MATAISAACKTDNHALLSTLVTGKIPTPLGVDFQDFMSFCDPEYIPAPLYHCMPEGSAFISCRYDLLVYMWEQGLTDLIKTHLSEVSLDKGRDAWGDVRDEYHISLDQLEKLRSLDHELFSPFSREMTRPS